MDKVAPKTSSPDGQSLISQVQPARLKRPLSRIGLGTWGLGSVYYGEVTVEQGVAAVRGYLDAGGRHVDTAFAYHQSEDVIGAALKGYNREEIFLSSKTYSGSFNYEDIGKVRNDLEISLRDLGTDYLDCYMIHGSPKDPGLMHALLDEFDAIKATGKIRHVGVSIRGPNIDAESEETARLYLESGRIDMIQLSYSIARPRHRSVFELARQQGVAVIARWVLESGMLAGKYPIGHYFKWPDTRNRYLDHQRDSILQIGLDIKEDLPEGFRNPVEVATAFALSEPGVTGVILGANTAEHAKRNCELDKLPPLPEDYKQRLLERYAAAGDSRNPTGEFEHVDSPRRPLED